MGIVGSRSGVVAVALALAAGCGRIGFLEAGSDVDATTNDGSTTDATTAFNCAGRPAATSYSFTSDLEGWNFWTNTGITGSESWTSAGKTDPGAMQVDVTVGAGPTLLGWIYAAMPVGDMSNRYAAVWIQSATPNLDVKLYARMADGNWADGGAITLVPDMWSCLTLDLVTPSFTTPQFDAANVEEFGVQVDGSPPATLWIDAPGY